MKRIIGVFALLLAGAVIMAVGMAVKRATGKRSSQDDICYGDY